MRKLFRAVSGICLAASLIASPALAQYTGPVEVETTSFGENTFDIGSLTPSTGALSQELWAGTNAEDVAFLLETVPTSYDSPAQLDLLRRALLSPGSGPAGADTMLTVQKLRTLADAGFYEEAASLAELNGGLSSQPDLAQAVAYADMLRGDIALACRRGANLQNGRSEPFWLKLRTLCYLENGETAAADLTLGLLREQGALMSNEEQLFTALITGRELDSPPVPVTGFDYVAARKLGATYTSEQLDDASGIILRAVANDPSQSQAARAYAIHEALYMGVLRPSDARSLVRAIELTPEQVATSREALADRPQDPLTSLIVFQAAAQMTAPEFTIDRSILIGDALQSAETAKDFTVLAKLFAPLADEVEVVVNYTPYAIEYALAGIVAENDGLTRKWIGALTADQSNPAGVEDAGVLLSLLALRDERLAQSLAGSAGIEVTPMEPGWQTAADMDSAVIPQMVRVGLSTARERPEGQAALSWLILTHVETDDGPLGEIRSTLLDNARTALDTVNITGELAFEAALEEVVVMLVETRPLEDTGPVVIGEGEAAQPATGPASRIMPRVKPGGDE